MINQLKFKIENLLPYNVYYNLFVINELNLFESNKRKIIIQNFNDSNHTDYLRIL